MNYKPGITGVKLLKKKPYQIFCRNFLFMILFFEFIKTSAQNTKNNFKIFIYKKRKHIGSFLRAPYKNKIAQFSLGLLRYYIHISYKISILKKIYFFEKNNFNFKIKNFLNSYNYFESALVTQIYRVIKIPIYINIF
jgi:hypothetical protein